MAPFLTPTKRALLSKGTVIPAHPLALNERRKIDERRQRALTRYYLAAGVGGVAVGVHTTQFEIRAPGINLLEPVLRFASETVDEVAVDRPVLKVAGICGPTQQALEEAELARSLGYDIGLLSPNGLKDLSETALLERSRAVAEVMPLFGFYLQPAVGGKALNYNFWREFAEIPGVMAIKIAPFDRYQTLDVVRAVCASSRRNDIALYTGNDDNILVDLLTPYSFIENGQVVEKRMVGGLLGQWAVGTKRAVELFEQVKRLLSTNDNVPLELLSLAAELTDFNAAIFDATNNFKGCIPGIHEVLRHYGLLKGIWCLNPEETLSPGQADEVERVLQSYPHLNDGDFVKEHCHMWIES